MRQFLHPVSIMMSVITALVLLTLALMSNVLVFTLSGQATEQGATMSDVVTSVRRVTDIMDEMSAASQEQSDGIEQVSQAIGQMDQVTQQNTSLVQQDSAAAASLEEQASRLEEAVSVFRLSGESGSARPALSSPAPTARQKSAPPPSEPGTQSLHAIVIA